jgi:hypothetical protein
MILQKMHAAADMVGFGSWFCEEYSPMTVEFPRSTVFDEEGRP